MTKTLLAAVVLLLCASCRKSVTDLPQPQASTVQKTRGVVPDSFFVAKRKIPGFILNPVPAVRTGNAAGQSGGTGSFEDNEQPTILGAQLPNPYTIPNMQAVYQLIGDFNTPAVTHRYVRFRPQDYAQLATLDELDLEMQDHPMDYEVLQDGDYYLPAGSDPEQIPWLYTVVPVHYPLPTSVPYEVLADLHLPVDNLFLEELAESLAAGGQYSSSFQGGYLSITRTDLAQPASVTVECPCDDPAQPCPVPPQCLPVPPSPPPPGPGPNPVPPAPSPNRPRGRITVWDTHLNGGVSRGVNTASVTIKRWFKHDRVYTDGFGYFFSNLQFNNRFSVIVKFRNNMASVRSLRGARVWQMLLPVERKIGQFQNNFTNCSHTFNRDATINTAWQTNWMRLWMAATVHNQLQQHTWLALDENVGYFTAPRRLNVLLTNHALGIKSGADFRAPMHKQKSADFDLNDAATAYKVVKFALKGKAAIPMAIYNAIKLAMQSQLPDIVIAYRTDLENLSSSEVASKVYGAMTLASLYKATDLAIYNAASKAIFKAMDVAATVHNTDFDKWKDDAWTVLEMAGLSAGIISFFNTLVAEKPTYELYHGYALYMGHFLAGKQYGFNADAVKNQKRETIGSLGSLNPHTRYLEDWSPTESADAYRWVPVGLFYDLVDGVQGFEAASTITDDVGYFTNRDLWLAMTFNGPLTIEYFRNTLNGYQPANTATTNTLFRQYNH